MKITSKVKEELLKEHGADFTAAMAALKDLQEYQEAERVASAWFNQFYNPDEISFAE